MVGHKVERFEGKGTDLAALQSHVEEYLKSDGFKVQATGPSTQGAIVQATKGGFLAGLVDADRALTITIEGSPDDFSVHVGIGRWLEHIATAAIETLLVSVLFLPVDVAEITWNEEIESKLVKDMKAFIG